MSAPMSAPLPAKAPSDALAAARPRDGRDVRQALRRLEEGVSRGIHGKPDVVRLALAALAARGHLLIESEVGVGTDIVLKLPLTLAIIPVMMVRTGQEQFAIPVTQVQQSALVSAGDIQRTEQGEVVLRGEETIPLLRLRTALQVPDGEGNGATQMAVLSEIRGRTVAVVVDEILGYRDAVVKPLGPALKGLRGLAGVTILPSGEAVLILDLNTLFG